MGLSGSVFNIFSVKMCPIYSKFTLLTVRVVQIDEVLTKDSAEEIEKGNNPGPMTEIQFWKAKCENLESLYDQVSSHLWHLLIRM